jgi:hypothetical protein
MNEIEVMYKKIGIAPTALKIGRIMKLMKIA